VFDFVRKNSDERVRVRMTNQAEGMRFVTKVRILSVVCLMTLLRKLDHTASNEKAIKMIN
jgi:hypothetical protein